MHKKNFRLFLAAGLIILTLAACQVATAVPEATTAPANPVLPRQMRQRCKQRTKLPKSTWSVTWSGPPMGAF